MRRIIYLFIICVGIMITGFSCSSDDNTIINDLYAEVYEGSLKFQRIDDKNYQSVFIFPSTVYDSDAFLVYVSLVNGNGKKIWKLIPMTSFDTVGNGNIYYDFDFTSENLIVYFSSDFTIDTSTHDYYINNAYFKIVLVPGSYINSTNTKSTKSIQLPVDINDYDAVAKYLKIDESRAIRIKQ